MAVTPRKMTNTPPVDWKEHRVPVVTTVIVPSTKDDYYSLGGNSATKPAEEVKKQIACSDSKLSSISPQPDVKPSKLRTRASNKKATTTSTIAIKTQMNEGV